jgi:hypothetical protein
MTGAALNLWDIVGWPTAPVVAIAIALGWTSLK